MIKNILSATLLFCVGLGLNAQEQYVNPQSQLTSNTKQVSTALYRAHFDEPLEGAVFSSPDNPLYASKDYSLSVTVPLCADDNKIPLSLKIGKDVKAVRYMCVEGDYAANSANYDIVAMYGDEIGADEDDLGSKVLELDMVLEMTTERSSRFTLLIVTLDKEENGTPQQKVKAYFYSINDDNDNWNTKGTSNYVEDIVSDIYSSINSTSTSVTVQEHKDIKGYYRLVNPYGSGWSYRNKNKYSHSHKHYIYIHAEDPEKVYLDESPICLDLGNGGVSVASMATPDFNSGDISQYYGKKEDSVITFPKKALLMAMQNYNAGQWYKTNLNGKFWVKIPNDQTGIQNVEMSDEASEPIYYNLQGIRVDQPQKGIFIVVRDDKTKKELLP